MTTSAPIARRAPSVERNRDPILRVLEQQLPARGRLLELASGTGEHAAYWARHFPTWQIQPTDFESEALLSIEGHRQTEHLANLLPPIRLDVLSAPWPLSGAPFEAAFCANMIHIAPARATPALLAGVGTWLATGGVFVLYGPFRWDGQHTAPSNVEFDAWLKAKDPDFGVRDGETVISTALAHGLELRERIAMPANNFCLVFVRGEAEKLSRS